MTATKRPIGKSTSICFRLCSAAPRTENQPLSSERRSGTAISRVPARNCPVTDFLFRCTFEASPSATTWPPCSPAPGPMSTSQSELRIICSSCSTTMTVLPRSRRRSSVPISRLLSRWWSPIDGSWWLPGGDLLRQLPPAVRLLPRDDELPVHRFRAVTCTSPFAVVVLSLGGLLVRHLNLGIDFKGGTSWEVKAQGVPRACAPL